MIDLTAVLTVSFCLVSATKQINDLKCNVSVRIDSGWVCGLLRDAEFDVKYASFRGIPYAEQPLGGLRFKELRPAKKWSHHLDATEEGPVCPQEDVLYGQLVKPFREMNESCIHVNVHVPIDALSKPKNDSSVDPPTKSDKNGHPIFVFIHGGGFSYGSGDADLHGPEYLVRKGFIVITFNYRLNVFGFLSLDTPEIPGNAGLRDQLTLLRWVQRNARAFGGNPHEVTLAGQSAGAVSAHLLALSNQSSGLFKRLILMSGTGVPAFYTPSPIYARQVADMFLKAVGINSTDPHLIHNQLINMPIEKIMKANSELLYEVASGTASFMPVVESYHSGVTRIVDNDPVILIHHGRDKAYPMIVGLTNNECESFRDRFEKINLLNRIKNNPTMILDTRLQFTTTPDVATDLTRLIINRFFSGDINMDMFMAPCKDTLIKYPAFQLGRWRGMINAASTFMYQFTYESEYSVLKDALNIQYDGNAHIEDLFYLFHAGTYLSRRPVKTNTRDEQMKDWMTTFVVNFMRCNDPSCGNGWPPVDPRRLNYQSIYQPDVYNDTSPTSYEWNIINFHDEIHQIARNLTAVK